MLIEHIYMFNLVIQRSRHLFYLAVQTNMKLRMSEINEINEMSLWQTVLHGYWTYLNVQWWLNLA